MSFDWVTSLIVIAVLIVCGLLVLYLCEKYDILLFDHHIFFPYMDEYKKWVDRELSNTSVQAEFTGGALEFIKARCPKESSLLIILGYRCIRSRGGGFLLPCAETRLGVPDPSADFVKVESNAGIPLLVARKIYEVLKQKKIPLTVTTSGLWMFKKLAVKQDLSWFLYSEEMRRKGKRWHYEKL